MSFLRGWLEKRGYVKVITEDVAPVTAPVVSKEPPPRWVEVLPASPSILLTPGAKSIDDDWEDVIIDETVTVVIDIVETTDPLVAIAALEQADVELDGVALGTVDQPGVVLRLPDRTPANWVGPRDQTQMIDVSEVLDSRSVDSPPPALAPGMVPARRK
jgi:hypothetical protein